MAWALGLSKLSGQQFLIRIILIVFINLFMASDLGFLLRFEVKFPFNISQLK